MCFLVLVVVLSGKVSDSEVVGLIAIKSDVE